MSTDTEDEAKALIIACCPRGADGKYYARELMHDQSLENLEAFAVKLEHVYERIRGARASKPVAPKKRSKKR